MMVGKKAQSVLEYVIVLAVIIAAVIAFATGFLRSSVERSLNHIGNEMETKINSVNIP